MDIYANQTVCNVPIGRYNICQLDGERLMTFLTRQIENNLRLALADTPVVCLLGARQVGKTTLARKIEPQRAYFNFDDEQVLQVAQADPAGFVNGLPDRVTLDEIQRVPELLLVIKAVVDEARLAGDNSFGRFLLTGSANLLLLPQVSESLAGRMEIIFLQPLTEWEKQTSGSQREDFLLAQMLNQSLGTQMTQRHINIDALAEAVCQGGYPEPIARSQSRANRWFQQYIAAIMEKDVKDIAGIHDERELKRLLGLLALRTANLLNKSALACELRIERRTVERYLAVLEKLFLVRQLASWHRNEAKRLIKTPKVHVCDSGLVCALRGLKVEDWLKKSTEFGHVLESFVVQQLMTQATWLDEALHFYHYRDKDQVEVDLVIEHGADVWGIEIKRAAKVSLSDAKGLQRLKTQSGKNFVGGVLLYSGQAVFPLDDAKQCYAVPLSYLWT